jgi:hypothetical protein
VRLAAWNRVSQAGAQMMNWLSLAHELQTDWRYAIEDLDTHHREMNDARNVASIIKKDARLIM